MHVFVTGATGFICQALVADLIAHGHRVVRLARTPQAAEKLRRAGVEPHAGSLRDLESLRRGAAAADAVARAAGVPAAAGDDLRRHGASRSSRRASDSGAGTDAPNPLSPGYGRAENEAAVQRWAQRGVRASVVRLAPSVHGEATRA